MGYTIYVHDMSSVYPKGTAIVPRYSRNVRFYGQNVLRSGDYMEQHSLIKWHL